MSGENYDEMVKKMTGYSKAELDAAWDLVKPASHWKDPINALIPKESESVVRAAVEFFTATVPTFLVAEMPGTVRVVADGYRAGPAGDH